MGKEVESKALLLERFERSERWRRPFEDKWLRWYKTYRGIVPKLPRGEEDRSNLHIPYVYSTLDTVRSRLMSALFASRPYISYVPVGENDVAAAENMQMLVDMQLEKGDVLQKMYYIITDMLLYGTCLFETGWRYETREVERREPEYVLGIFTGYRIVREQKVVWDDPDFNTVMLDEVYPDPEGSNIDECEWIIRKKRITEEELKHQERLGFYKIKDMDALRSSVSEERGMRDEKLAAIGITSADSGVSGHRYEVLEMWEDNRVVTLINRKEVVRDVKNPFNHGKKPFGLVRYDPSHGEFYGTGLVEVTEHLSAELNTTRNQRIDAVSIALNQMYKVLKTAGIVPEDLISRPGGIVWVDRMDDVQSMNFNAPGHSAYAEEKIIKEDIQEVTAAYPEARGGTTPGEQTATEAAIRDQGLSLRFKVKSSLFEASGLKRLGMFYDKLNQQYIDSEKRVRVSTDSGYEWRPLLPEDLVGTYDYKPIGTAIESTLNVINHRANMLALFEKFGQDPEIKTRELKKRLLEAFGIKDTENILKPEQQVQQEQAEMAAPEDMALAGGNPAGANIQQILAGLGQRGGTVIG